MNTDDRRFDWIIEGIIGCACLVANRLGHGFLEKCCENALVLELRTASLRVRQQVPLEVLYDGVVRIAGPILCDPSAPVHISAPSVADFSVGPNP